MSKELINSEITVVFAEHVWKASQSFANGIYVATSKGEGHPCGWDFISFEGLECSTDVESEPIEDCNISSGYGSETYADMTLLDILKECHGRFVFELNQIDW